MNVFFDIPSVLQVSILTEWVNFRDFKKLHAAGSYNKKRKADLQELLHSDKCTFHHQRVLPYGKDPDQEDTKWVITNGVKVNGVELYESALTCPERRQEALQCAAAALQTVVFNLTCNLKDRGEDGDLLQPSEALFDFAIVLEEISMQYPHVKNLHLTHSLYRENLIPIDAYQSFYKYFSTTSTLVSVLLNSVKDISELLLIALCSAGNLHTVKFKNCTFSPEAVNCTYQRTSTTVRKLVISKQASLCALFSNVTDLSVRSINADDISFLTQSCPHVRTLELIVEENHINEVTIHTMSVHWQSLTTVSIRCGLSESMLCLLIEKCATLTSITTVGQTEKNVPYVAYPAHYTGSRLRVLRTKCDLADTLVSVVTLCPYLHTLAMEPSGKRPGTLAFNPLTHALHYLSGDCSVQHLSLSGYTILGEELSTLRNSNIHTLHLTKCNELTSASIVQLVPTLPNLHTLKLIMCADIGNIVVMDVPPQCPTLRSFTYTQSNGCGCCGRTSSPSLLRKLLPTLYSQVNHFHIDC